MDTATVTPLLGLLGSVVTVALTYGFTKRRERDAEWRKEKLVYYKAFVESLSGIVEGDDSPQGHKLYARACNNLLLFAPQPVIDGLNVFRSETAASNANRTRERHDRLLGELLLAIRRDIGVVPADDLATFQALLWTSGVKKEAT